MPDSKMMTHINYAFGHVNNTFDGVRVDNPERLKQIVALKKENPELKVLILSEVGEVVVSVKWRLTRSSVNLLQKIVNG